MRQIGQRSRSGPPKLRATGIAAALASVLIIAGCGGATPTATPQPTKAPPPTVQPTATATVRPQATAQPTAQATATAVPTARATATAVPTARPTATPAPTATATPKPSDVPQFPEAKKGGMLLRPIGGDAPSWDALIERTEWTQHITQPVYDQLVQMNPYAQDEVIPQIAESWEQGKDGLTWTFKIRKGILFHDGTPLTAQDVKFTFEMIATPPKGTLSPFAPFLETVESISAPDDYTVVLKQKAADAAFLSGLGFGRMSVFSKKLVEQSGRERTAKWPPIGTGPFKAKPDGFLKGSSVELVKNDKYFVPGRPFIDGQKFFVIPDNGTQFAAFLTGQVNFDLMLTPSQTAEAKQRLGNRVFIQEEGTTDWWAIALNTGVKPFNDVRLREAVTLAVDKPGAIQAVKQGLGKLGGYAIPGTGWGLTEEELKQVSGWGADHKANVAKAKQLMADAGYPNGLTITYLVRNHPYYIDLTTVVKEMLQAIGIKGEMNIIESTVYFNTKTAGNTTWQIGPGPNRTAGTDPNSAYREFHLPGSARNTSNLKDQKVIDLFNAQNVEADPVKRKARVKELERYTLSLYTHPPVFYVVAQYGWHSNVKNYKNHVSIASNRQMRDVWIE